MDISIVIPLFNEEESLPELFRWIEKVLTSNNLSYEVVFVDDGSTDKSWNIIENLKKINNNIKAIRFRRNYGKSPALHCAFQIVEGDVVITMDADLQDSPEEIPELYKMIKEMDYDLVSGWKKKRYDSFFSKNLPSKFFNYTARKVSKIKLHDFNCGLKAYKKEVVKNIEIYNDMHRYIPILAKDAGFNKIGEKIVIHQSRKYGESKFGMNRFINGYLDLLTIWFLNKFGKKPMHFFGLWGTIMFIIGLIDVVYLGLKKIIDMNSGHDYRLVTESPYFYISLTLMILGTGLFLAGFLGEIISRNSNERNSYKIEKKL